MCLKSFLFLILTTLINIIKINSTLDEKFIKDEPIIFERADLIVEFETDYDKINLEAFASRFNDHLLNTNDKSKYSQLEWFTIGNPTLVKAEKEKYFKLNNDGFIMYVSMLDKEHKNLFKHTVKKKYGIDIEENQIFNLILSKFECSIPLKKIGSRAKYLIKGKVERLNVFPIRMEFYAPIGSDERDLFEAKIRLDESINSRLVNLELKCDLSSHLSGPNAKRYFILDLETMNGLDLVSKLFISPSNDKSDYMYATYNQILNLAYSLYDEFSIDEFYNLSHHEFINAFMDEFLNKTTENGFKFEPFEDVINYLSLYNLNKDFNVDAFKLHMPYLLKISEINSIELIIADLKTFDHIKTISGLNNNQFKSSNSLYSGEMFGISFLFNFIELKTNEWIEKNKPIKGQLTELNEYNDGHYKWIIDKNKRIIPAKIKVARFIKSKFLNNLIFKSIFNEDNKGFNKRIILKTINDSPSNIPENNQRLKYIEKILDYLSKRLDSDELDIKKFKDDSANLRIDLNGLNSKLVVQKEMYEICLNQVNRLKNQTYDLQKETQISLDNALNEYNDRFKNFDYEFENVNVTLFNGFKIMNKELENVNIKFNSSLNTSLDTLKNLTISLLARILKLDEELRDEKNKTNQIKHESKSMNELVLKLNQTKKEFEIQNGFVEILSENLTRLRMELLDKMNNYENYTNKMVLNKENKFIELIKNQTDIFNNDFGEYEKYFLKKYGNQMENFNVSLLNGLKGLNESLKSLSLNVNKLDMHVNSLENKLNNLNKSLFREKNNTFLNKLISDLSNELKLEKNQNRKLEKGMNNLKDIVAKQPVELSNKLKEFYRSANDGLKKLEKLINDDRKTLKTLDSELENLNNKLNNQTQETYNKINISLIRYDNNFKKFENNLNSFYVKLFNSTRLVETMLSSLNESLNANTLRIYNKILRLDKEIEVEKSQTQKLKTDLNYTINEFNKITNKSLARIDNDFKVFYEQINAETSDLHTKINDINKFKTLEKKNLSILNNNLKIEQNNLNLVEDKLKTLKNQLYYIANKVVVSKGSFLIGNQELNENEQLVSVNGEFNAKLELNGNFVVYKGVKIIFETKTASDLNHPFVLKLEEKGNLVLYDIGRKILWSTGTNFVLPHLVMRDDGNLVLYDHVNKIFWTSDPRKVINKRNQ